MTKMWAHNSLWFLLFSHGLFIACSQEKALIPAKPGKQILLKVVTEESREMEKLLIDIMVKSISAYSCIVIICDSVYYSVFREDVFFSMDTYISYFIILIEDHDDLLSPYPDTQESLLMVRRQDCQTYIILLANGLQMSRLLQFGDRYRVLDTRANFVLLYDNRLFDKELHYIWKRIVNVIFIKEYLGIKKVANNEKKTIPWFELSTVPFPAPIRGILVPRRVDIWRAGKFRMAVNLFSDKTSDLRNQSMKVATFQHIPAAKKVDIPMFKDSRSILKAGNFGYSGIEIEILSAVAKTMNFYPELYEPENIDEEFWGDKQEDGSLSGLFGELIRSKAEIGLGDFYYTPYILNIMDLTLPYTTECLTFLTPESLTDNSWKTLILPFKPLMWFSVLTAMFFISFFFFYLAKFHMGLVDTYWSSAKRRHPQIPSIQMAPKDLRYSLMRREHEIVKEEGEPEGLNLFGDAVNSCLYTFGMILMISLPKVPTGWSLRLLTGWYWLYCTLVVVSYRASMTAILANPSPRVTIDSLEQLLASDLSIGGWGEFNKDFFVTSLDPISQELGNRFEVINNTDVATERVALGKFALYENIHFLKQSAVKRQLRFQMMRPNLTDVQIAAERNLHIMSNCIINMPVSIGLQKNSPIKPRIDNFIRRVIEAGLIEKWLNDVMQSTLTAEIATDDGPKAIMSMQKFFGAIVALLVGYFISVCGFIGEIIYFKRVIAKHPEYDKYAKAIIPKKGKGQL